MMQRQAATIAQQDQSVLAAASFAVASGTAAIEQGRQADAVRWFARATRLVPRDPAVALLHARSLAAVDAVLALPAARALASQYPTWRASQTLMMAVAHDAGDHDGAAMALGGWLQTMACAADPKFTALAARIAAAAGMAGWLGLTRGGTVFAAGATRVTLDGRPLRLAKSRDPVLPPDWRRASALCAEHTGRPLLGSPVDIQAVLRLHGEAAEAEDGAIEGWVEPGAEMESAPCIDIFDAAAARHLLRLQPSAGTRAQGHSPPGALGFRVAADRLPRWHKVRIFAVDPAAPMPDALADAPGLRRELAGSPLRRGARAAAAMARDAAASVASRPGAAAALTPAGPSAVGFPTLALCFVTEKVTLSETTLAPASWPDAPVFWCGPAGTAPPGATIVPVAEDADFAARVNLCLRAAAPRDIVLLRPDCGLPGGALARLAAIAARHPDAGTISSLHGGSGICGLRRPGFDAADLREAVAAANADMALAVPSPDGPCIFIRHAALADIGWLREDVFGETMGGLADFAFRAAARGWRHLAACGVVTAAGAGAGDEDSDGALEWLHPARRAADEILWARGRRPGAVILVTHADGGGIERHVAARANTAARAGLRAILLRPVPDGVAVSEPDAPSLPDLVYKMPAEIDRLTELLRGDRPRYVEFHHAASHVEMVQSLPARLGVPHDVRVHDYAAICPRVTLCGGAGRYCGEPVDVRDCQDCVADHGARVPGATDVAAWRERSASLLCGARTVAAPSEDAARRIVRHFPAARTVVTPWDDDSDAAACVPRHPVRRSPTRLHVAVLGALTKEKGFDVLLACARDAARRALPLHFTLVGHSIGDSRLLETGHVFVTGPFAEGQGPALLREAAADVALLPALWPETWSYALSDLWRAGLWVVAFDIGAPAARIRAAGGGTLLPTGLPAARLNDSMLALLFRNSARVTATVEANVRRHV